MAERLIGRWDTESMDTMEKLIKRITEICDNHDLMESNLALSQKEVRLLTRNNSQLRTSTDRLNRNLSKTRNLDKFKLSDF